MLKLPRAESLRGTILLAPISQWSIDGTKTNTEILAFDFAQARMTTSVRLRQNDGVFPFLYSRREEASAGVGELEL
jgi:hypothetical protein